MRVLLGRRSQQIARGATRFLSCNFLFILTFNSYSIYSHCSILKYQCDTLKDFVKFVIIPLLPIAIKSEVRCYNIWANIRRSRCSPLGDKSLWDRTRAHYIVPWGIWHMMTSSNGNIFRVTGLLCGEFTGHWWIPLTKANDAELWCFPWSVPE